MPDPSKPQFVAGGEHTLAVARDGACYSSGACGLGWTRLRDVVPALFGWRRAPMDEPVAKACGGYYHSLAVGASGTLYAWGCGVFCDGGNDGVIPALGRPDASAETIHPTAVDGAGPVAAVAAGAYHSVALTKDGRVVTFGAAQLGQLGRSPDGGGDDKAGLPVDARPRPVEGLDEAPLGVGAAFYNSFVRCKSGVLCAGENAFRQCGAGPRNLHTLATIEELRGSDVREVTGGYCHLLARTLGGRVLTLGCGDDGQRGDGRDCENDERPVVTEAALPGAAVQIAAGANHSLALLGDGSAYGWGSNEFGQLGDESENAAAPRRIPAPPGCTYAAVSAGYAHSVLTDDRGRAWAFGRGGNGQLALGHDDDVASPSLCNELPS